MNDKDYWVEAVMSSFEEHGVSADAEQIEKVADDVRLAHQNYDTAFGHDVASANLSGEKDRKITELAKALDNEQRKVRCERCEGRGVLPNDGGPRTAANCSKCRGEGRHAP